MANFPSQISVVTAAPETDAKWIIYLVGFRGIFHLECLCEFKKKNKVGSWKGLEMFFCFVLGFFLSFGLLVFFKFQILLSWLTVCCL